MEANSNFNDDPIGHMRQFQKFKKDFDSLKRLQQTLKLVKKMESEGKLSTSNGKKIKRLVKGNRLRILRMKNKVTLGQLSARMGVSRDYLMKLETGQIQVTKEQLETIEAFLNQEL